MSTWNGDDLRYWAKKIGCQYLNQLAPMVGKTAATIHQYSGDRCPIPAEVQEKILSIHKAQLQADQDEHYKQEGDLLAAKLAFAETITPPPPRRRGPSPTHWRLPGYYSPGGKLLPPDDTPYPPKWLSVPQAVVVREALKHWASAVASRYKELELEQLQHEHRLELHNIRAVMAALPRPDHITQSWVLTHSQWPVVSRALRNYYHATNTIRAHTFYNTLRRNLNNSRKLTPGGINHGRPGPGVSGTVTDGRTVP